MISLNYLFNYSSTIWTLINFYLLCLTLSFELDCECLCCCATRNNHTPCCPLFTISCLCELFNLFCFPHIDIHRHTHTHRWTHTHAVTNRNKNGKFCLLCHRHLELNFIYFAIATVIIASSSLRRHPEGAGGGKVVPSAGCFHQQQDAMLTTTVGLNNNTCRNIIFMPWQGEGDGGRLGPNRFYDTHQALGLL